MMHHYDDVTMVIVNCCDVKSKVVSCQKLLLCFVKERLSYWFGRTEIR